MSTPKPISAFAKAMRRSHASSRAGTLAAERVNVVQTDKLRPFTAAQRTGQPLKAADWREGA